MTVRRRKILAFCPSYSTFGFFHPLDLAPGKYSRTMVLVRPKSLIVGTKENVASQRNLRVWRNPSRRLSCSFELR